MQLSNLHPGNMLRNKSTLCALGWSGLGASGLLLLSPYSLQNLHMESQGTACSVLLLHVQKSSIKLLKDIWQIFQIKLNFKQREHLYRSSHGPSYKQMKERSCSNRIAWPHTCIINGVVYSSVRTNTAFLMKQVSVTKTLNMYPDNQQQNKRIGNFWIFQPVMETEGT